MVDFFDLSACLGCVRVGYAGLLMLYLKHDYEYAGTELAQIDMSDVRHR